MRVTLFPWSSLGRVDSARGRNPWQLPPRLLVTNAFPKRFIPVHFASIPTHRLKLASIPVRLRARVAGCKTPSGEIPGVFSFSASVLVIMQAGFTGLRCAGWALPRHRVHGRHTHGENAVSLLSDLGYNGFAHPGLGFCQQRRARVDIEEAVNVSLSKAK